MIQLETSGISMQHERRGNHTDNNNDDDDDEIAFSAVAVAATADTQPPSSAAASYYNKTSSGSPYSTIRPGAALPPKNVTATTFIHSQDEEQQERRREHQQFSFSQQQPQLASHQNFLYQNGKSPIPNRAAMDMSTVSMPTPNGYNYSGNHNNPYPGPSPMPFSPVPVQQSLQAHDAFILGGGATSSGFVDANNLNAASRQMYTAAITKLKTQLDDTQKQLAAKTIECDNVRRELSQRDRDSAALVHNEVKSRVDAERAELVADHNRQQEKLRDHYQSMVEQLQSRVRAADAEAEELRLRVAAMTSKVAESQSASARDKAAVDAMQRRYEAELSAVREQRDKEVEHLRHELECSRASTDGRDKIALQQVSSLQSDVRRLQSELEQSRAHESRLQAERDEDSRRFREEREAATRETEHNLRRAQERAKNAEAEAREAIDRALRSERQLSDERSRRERLQEEAAALETKEHEAVRALARREAEIARLEARIESLTVKANAFANEAASVRHEFEVRESRDRTEEKLAFEQRLSQFRERSQSSRFITSAAAPPPPAVLLPSADEPAMSSGVGVGVGGRYSSSHVASLVQTPIHQQHYQRAPSYHTNDGINSSANNSFSAAAGNGTAHGAFQEALESTQNEIRDLKRALAQIPVSEFTRRGGPQIESRIEACLEEIKRLNERVSRTEASQVRNTQVNQAQTNMQMQLLREQASRMQTEQQQMMMHAQQQQRPPASSAASTPMHQQQQRHQQQQQQQQQYVAAAPAGMSPAMRSIEALRNELVAGRQQPRR